MSGWYVWIIVQSKIKDIIKHLDETDGVEDYIFPTLDKEFKSKNRKYSRKIPIYGNYLFIKYENTNRIQSSLMKCEWLKNCIGQCNNEEILEIRKVANSDYDDIMPSCGIKNGDNVILKQGGMSAKVINIVDGKLTVSIDLFGAERITTCSMNDILLDEC